MKLQSPISTQIVADLSELAEPNVPIILSEDYEPNSGSMTLDLKIRALSICAIMTPRDFTLAVKEEDGGFDRWAHVCYIYAFVTRDNCLDHLSMRDLVRWLVSNFDRVYGLICNPEQKAEKQEMMNFAASVSEERRKKRWESLQNL